MKLYSKLMSYIEKNSIDNCKDLIMFFPHEIRARLLQSPKIRWLPTRELTEELSYLAEVKEIQDAVVMYTFIYYSFEFDTTYEGHTYWDKIACEFRRNDNYSYSLNDLFKYLI